MNRNKTNHLGSLLFSYNNIKYISTTKLKTEKIKISVLKPKPKNANTNIKTNTQN